MTVSLGLRLALLGSCMLGLWTYAAAQTSAGLVLEPARATLEGFAPTARPATGTLHLAIELAPKDQRLDALATMVVDPSSPHHRDYLTQAQFVDRFGRSPAELGQLTTWLASVGGRNVVVAGDRLVVGADLAVADAARAFGTPFAIEAAGTRTAIAPRGPLHLPFGFVRDVRGTITAYTPQLADAPTLPSDFRGAWFAPKRFREAYDAVADGGRGMRIVLMEDATDRADVADLTTFVQGHSGTPLPPSPSPQQERNATFAQAIAESGTFGADPARVHVDDIASPSPDDNCRRDDRGQEPTIDVDAAITLAPAAGVEVRYDAICLPGGDGTLALARALDSATPNDVIVFPFVVAAVYGPSSDAFGPVPIPYLEAAVRGIPLVVPSGDDGAYGVRTPGIDRAAVTYPCVLAVTICAGGTEVGTRNGQIDEGPWNDGLNAGGGGISADPRPAWQTAPSSFEFSPQFVTTRMVPDVSADAAGHLYIFWHGYGTGGVGGTSESAALVGAELAAINAAVPADRRLISSGDLYTLAAAHPPAVRDVTRPNDRNYGDNTLRPRLPALPKNFVGVLPSPPPVVVGCAKVQPRGCAVKIGYDAVTGLGSLKERAAIDALRASPSRRQASLGARS